MKILFSLLICLLMLLSCTTKSTKPEYAFVKPLPSEIDLSNLENVEAFAEFNVSDINWEDRTITLDVYDYLRFDSAEVNNLQVGDTIYLANNTRSHVHVKDTIIVDTIITHMWYDITVYGTKGPAIAFDDLYHKGYYISHSNVCVGDIIFTKLGRVTLPFSDDLCVVVKIESDSITENQQLWFENRKYGRDFWVNDTRVQIENGVIKVIYDDLF